jgi:ceramide synthetase
MVAILELILCPVLTAAWLLARRLAWDRGLRTWCPGSERAREEVFSVLASTLIVVCGLWTLSTNTKHRCGLQWRSRMLLDLGGCFEGPWASSDFSYAAYLSLSLAWYAHHLVKNVVFPRGTFVADGRMMAAHHGVTIALIAVCIYTRLHHIGSVIMVLLSLSNPFLHLAKAFHYVSDTSRASGPAFLVFALVFTVARLVVYPAVVLRATLVESLENVEVQNAPVVYLICNGMLLALLGLQIFWFVGIVRILVRVMS